MLTIDELAREYNSQPCEIAAALGLDYVAADQPIVGFTDVEAREVLDALAELTADIHN